MTGRLVALALAVVVVAAGCTTGETTQPSVVSVPSPPAVPEATTAPTSTTTGIAPSTTTSATPPSVATTSLPAVAPTSTPATTAAAASDPSAPADGPGLTATRPAQTLPVTVDRDLAVAGGLPVDIWYPNAGGPWPVTVLAHGGGWLSGSKADMSGFARALAEGGVVVVNAGYSPLDRGGIFPQMFAEVSCAVVTAQRGAAEYSGTGPITLIGFSAGAHIASVVALGGDEFDDGCDADLQPVERFVGIAGPYDSDQFPFLALQFGGLITEVPDAWAAGNPYTYVGEDPDLRALLLHGDNDIVVNPVFSADFAAALAQAGHEVHSQSFPRVGHFTIVRMDENGGPTAAAALEFIWADPAS